MKKFTNNKLMFLIVLIVFALFNALFFIIAGSTHALAGNKTGMWISFGFLELSFVLTGGIALFIQVKNKNNAVMLEPIFFVQVGYLALSVLANAIMMAASKYAWQAPVIVNIIFLAIYAVLLLLSYKAFSRVRENTEHQKAKVQELRQTTIKVNSLIYLAKDEEVKKAIKKLKEDLDYSSPMSTPDCAEYEQQLAEMIDTLKTLLSTDSDSETILSAVAEAENVLRIRNQMLMATRR
ncbi:MAG: hypothetical protein ACI4MS_04860 [Candidatus Coproplasma sp.]